MYNQLYLWVYPVYIKTWLLSPRIPNALYFSLSIFYLISYDITKQKITIFYNNILKLFREIKNYSQLFHFPKTCNTLKENTPKIVCTVHSAGELYYGNVVRHRHCYWLIYLYVLPLCLVIEHMSYVSGWDFFTPCTSVNSHHGYSNGPGRVSDGHLQVSVIGLKIQLYIGISSFDSEETQMIACNWKDEDLKKNVWIFLISELSIFSEGC